jgi:hypothetical protein
MLLKCTCHLFASILAGKLIVRYFEILISEKIKNISNKSVNICIAPQQ